MIFQGEENQNWPAWKKAALGGTISGGLMGGLGSIIQGSKSIPQVARSSLIGALTAGGLAGTASGVGSQLYGKVKQSEGTPYTTRGMVGGLTGGSVLGAGLGALAGSGHIGLPDSQNIVIKYLSGLHESPYGAVKGALTGAAALGLLSGYYGSDEGMQLDFLHNLNKQADLKRRLRTAKIQAKKSVEGDS